MANSATNNGEIVFTIPANKIWHGSVMLCATLAVAVGGTAATSFPSITVSGSGGSLTDGDTAIALALFVPAVGVTALTGSQVTATLSTGVVTIKTRASPVSFILNIGTGVTGIGVAIGETL